MLCILCWMEISALHGAVTCTVSVMVGLRWSSTLPFVWKVYTRDLFKSTSNYRSDVNSCVVRVTLGGLFWAGDWYIRTFPNLRIYLILFWYLYSSLLVNLIYKPHIKILCVCIWSSQSVLRWKRTLFLVCGVRELWLFIGSLVNEEVNFG